ncbi:MAG: hypothetical protein J6K17_14665 [Oscillospiraceae bacterium]|nr:hypothetical protein [Oscillospiraceae bacterium]
MFTIQMASGFSGVHMGLVFANGKAQTNDAFLATRLKSKGYTVTAEKVADDTKAPEQVEKSEGKKKGGKKDKEKAAPAPEPTPAPEPEPTVDPESSEPPDLPPLDNEGDE